jgi:hypothetical protein
MVPGAILPTKKQEFKGEEHLPFRFPFDCFPASARSPSIVSSQALRR